MRLSIRYLAYPLVMVIVFISAVTLAASPGAAVALPLLTLAGVLTVGGLEWLSPYQTAWTKSHGDVWADLQYNVLGGVLIQASVHFIYPLSAMTVSLGVWPNAWPLWASVLGVGVIIDFGLYWMHRWSHRSPLLWRFHQPHHSPERLYWLNGERRHVVSALILATPGLVAVALLGAPQAAFAGWFSILPVHLAFQHANIDYSLGPARRLFGVAEMHRWHHKRDYEDAQVNFGEVFLVWDWLFGSLHGARENIEAGDLGLSDATYPKGFFSQHAAPFDPRR